MIVEIYEKKVEQMNRSTKIFAGIFILISSVTVLVMLTTSFELFQKKYLPSFILAQKFAFPLIIAAMATAYLAFFEPERLSERRTVVGMRILFVCTLFIHTYFITTVNISASSGWTLGVYVLQWLALSAETARLFFHKTATAA